MFKRVAFVYRVVHRHILARTIPMYTDDAMAVLGLPATATMDDAKKAYRTLMMIHHPDRGGDTAKAQDIIGAWTQLKDGITISRPYGSYRQQPSRPSPSPPQRPSQPSPQPSTPNRFTWRNIEKETGVSSRPDSKDDKRISDMFIRAKGDRAKFQSLAQQMANAINDAAKAARRGRATEEFSFNMPISVDMDIKMWVLRTSRYFYARALVLAGV